MYVSVIAWPASERENIPPSQKVGGRGQQKVDSYTKKNCFEMPVSYVSYLMIGEEIKVLDLLRVQK